MRPTQKKIFEVGFFWICELVKTTVRQTLAPETVDCPEIRPDHPGQPHVVHVLSQQPLHPAPGVYVAHIGIHEYLQQHPRMEAARSAALIRRLYPRDVKPVYYRTDSPHRMTFRYQLPNVGEKRRLSF